MQTLIKMFNDLGVDSMPTLTKLYGHKGDKINIECLLPNGERAKILDDSQMYYVAQLKNEETKTAFLLVTDKKQLAVFSSSEKENLPKLLIWKRI